MAERPSATFGAGGVRCDNLRRHRLRSQRRVVSNQDEKAKWLDQQMNAAYTTARLILPSTRFAEVKQEQIKWLKQRDAATSMEEKCNLMVARIKTLQELLW